MKKTTLIIGAGVNKEMNQGIGLGTELLQDISDWVTDRTSSHNKYLSQLFSKINIYALVGMSSEPCALPYQQIDYSKIL